MPETPPTDGGGLSPESKEALFLGILTAVVTDPVLKKMRNEMSDGRENVNAVGEQ